MPHDNDVHPLVGLDRRLSDAIACLTDVVTRHSPTAFASSFSAEDMVVLDLIAELGSPVSVFTLDTGRLPEETHALMERVRVHYGRPVRIRSVWTLTVANSGTCAHRRGRRTEKKAPASRQEPNGGWMRGLCVPFKTFRRTSRKKVCP